MSPLSGRNPPPVLRKSSEIHNRGFRESFVRTERVLGCEMPAERTDGTAALTGLHYEFGPFRLDAGRRALYRDGEFIPLTPKAAEILLLLLEEAGRVVTKEQLLERVWPGVVVEEGAIANNISALRKVLDSAFDGEGPIA